MRKITNKLDFNKAVQDLLNYLGASPKVSVDGEPGPKTYEALEKALSKYEPEAIPVLTPEKKKSPPWYVFALQFKGKKETDPEFAKIMVPKWKLFGMNLGTIAQSWAAWCGLAMAVSFAGVGIDYARNGALAKNWDQYAVAIEWKTQGIPQGAVVRLNHGGDCKSESGNHVAQANGDCSPADLLKSGASIDLYGGNQGNTWKVSTYSVREICSVRWPKDYEKPGMITKSLNCSSGNKDNESTQ